MNVQNKTISHLRGKGHMNTGCDFNGKFTHKTSLLPCTPEYNSFTLNSELMLHNSKANSASLINRSNYQVIMNGQRKQHPSVFQQKHQELNTGPHFK